MYSKKLLRYAAIIAAAGLAWVVFVLAYPPTEGQTIRQGEYPSDIIPLADLGAEYTTYTVKAGKQRFRPMRSLCPRGFAYGFAGNVRFDSSAYVFPREYAYNDGQTLDFDYFDWNKLYGYTGYLSRPNRRSAMIAFRWDVDSAYCFQLAAYTNDKRGDWRVSDPVQVCAGQTARFSMFEYKGEALYSIYSGAQVLRTRHPFKRPWITAEIDSWIGGANNADGPFGGAAVRELTLHLDAYVR